MAAPVVGCGGGRRAGGVGRQVRHLRAAPAQLMRRMTVVVLLVVEAVCKAVLEAGLAVVAGVALVDCRRTLSEKTLYFSVLVVNWGVKGIIQCRSFSNNDGRQCPALSWSGH